jgi:glycine cleavage system H protein
MNTTNEQTTQVAGSGKTSAAIEGCGSRLASLGFISKERCAPGSGKKNPLVTMEALQKPRPNKQNFPPDYWQQCSVHGCFCTDPKCPYGGVCESQWEGVAKVPGAVLDMLQIGAVDSGNNHSYVQQSGFRLGVVQDVLKIVYSEGGKHGHVKPADVGADTARKAFETLAAAAFADKLPMIDLEGFLAQALSSVIITDQEEGPQLDAGADVEQVLFALLTAELMGAGAALEPTLAEAMLELGRDVPPTRPDLARLSIVVQVLFSMHDAVPIRLSSDTVDFCTELANLSVFVMGKSFRGIVVNAPLIGQASVVAATLGTIGESAAKATVEVLKKELARLSADKETPAPHLSAVLAGIAALGGDFEHEEARTVADWNRQKMVAMNGPVQGFLAQASDLMAIAATDNLRRKAAEMRAPATGVLRAGLSEVEVREMYGVEVDLSLFYHAGHTWLRPLEGSQMAVGLDDFALRLVGKADSVELPQVGSKVRQGDVVCKVTKGGKTVGVLAPVTGSVVSVNATVSELMIAGNAEAYSGGWLFTIRPEAIAAEADKLLKGGKIVEFTRGEVKSLIHTVAAGGRAVAMDGAALRNDLLAGVPGVDWADVARQFFRT